MAQQKATFGAGCFWGVEHLFKSVSGVSDTEVGYMGGDTSDPTYKEVCSGRTGHAEVLQVTFDPDVVSYKELLHFFWEIHDPTTLNRQGPDMGTQYRSAVFAHDDEQRAVAEESKAWAQAYFKQPIVTEIVDAGQFYPAEDYHQDYFDHHGAHGCHIRRPFARES